MAPRVDERGEAHREQRQDGEGGRPEHPAQDHARRVGADGQ
jgi:hypothetical protein